MSKLSFRAKALDAGKPMPIYMADELPDLPDYSAINRAVPQMPSGMEKEEECEHHLQRAICAGLIIPTPEVSDIPDEEIHDKLYPANYKQPRQLIHMQPFAMEQDIPDYDMDSEDERWLDRQTQKLELSPLKFEEMMDRLEKSSGQTVVTIEEAKALLKEDDDLIIAVFDYWLNKRLNMQHPLILAVKTEHRLGTAANNPYLAFRRRTEKMQTRKNRKNDETSYEKMLKLRRDLSRAVTLLELVKRREKIKREYVHLTVEIVEKRYQARDFTGTLIAELAALKSSRPAFTPIFHNHYTNQTWHNKAILKDEIIPRKEKRQYKKRKHKSHSRTGGMGGGYVEGGGGGSGMGGGVASSDEELPRQPSPEPESQEDEGQFAFRRNKLCTYHMPLPTIGDWPWSSSPRTTTRLDDPSTSTNTTTPLHHHLYRPPEKKYRYTLTSVAHPRRRCIGFARRRLGRGGRVILDRLAAPTSTSPSHETDDFWSALDYTIFDSQRNTSCEQPTVKSVKSEFGAASGGVVVVNNSTTIREDSGVSGGTSATNSSFSASWCGEQRTAVSSSGDSGVGEQVVTVKQEVMEDSEIVMEDVVKEEEKDERQQRLHTKEEQDEMVEFLQHVRRDWLHFRPKTPPPDYTPPCHLLPALDDTFLPCGDVPFTLELRPLLGDGDGHYGAVPGTSDVMLDTSSFLTSPFLLDVSTLVNAAVTETVPVTDTRQTDHTSGEHQQPPTLTKPPTVGSSTFYLRDDNPNTLYQHQPPPATPTPPPPDPPPSSTYTTVTSDHSYRATIPHTGLCHPARLDGGGLTRYNNRAAAPPPPGYGDRERMAATQTGTTLWRDRDVATLTGGDVACVATATATATTTGGGGGGTANGIVTQLGVDVTSGIKTRNNRHHLFSNLVGNNIENSNSINHHTVTLNSHSANILELPLPRDSATGTDSTTVTSPPAPLVDAVVTTTTTQPPSPSSAAKATGLVRKNNLVMEVT